ncbi:hypothetical protein BN1723_019568, partial [Verticillium longisporum]
PLETRPRHSEYLLSLPRCALSYQAVPIRRSAWSSR